MLRISDFKKKLNYYFLSRHVRKKTSVSSFSQYILWLSVILLLLGHVFLGFRETRHLSVKFVGSRSDRRLTQVFAQS